MNNSLQEQIATKTDDELNDYLIDIKQHPATEVQAALTELQKRGKQYNDIQLEYINNVIKRKLIEEDPNNPVYYSSRDIYAFSVFINVLFGAIMLALNLKEKREKWVVIGFGITFLIFLATIDVQFGLHPLMMIVYNMIGGSILQLYFWNKYIGKDVVYKRRSITIPLLIAIAIVVVFITLVFTLQDVKIE